MITTRGQKEHHHCSFWLNELRAFQRAARRTQPFLFPDIRYYYHRAASLAWRVSYGRYCRVSVSAISLCPSGGMARSSVELGAPHHIFLLFLEGRNDDNDKSVGRSVPSQRLLCFAGAYGVGLSG
jgi:hypothetical protein